MSSTWEDSNINRGFSFSFPLSFLSHILTFFFLIFYLEQSQIVAQFAWNFVNDRYFFSSFFRLCFNEQEKKIILLTLFFSFLSLSTPIPLQYKAQHIAQAAIYLAAKSKKIPLTWAQLEVEEPFQSIFFFPLLFSYLLFQKI